MDIRDRDGARHQCFALGQQPFCARRVEGCEHPDDRDERVRVAVGVHPGRMRRALDHSQVVGLEDDVEGLAVLAVAVAQQEAQGLHAGVEVGGDVSGVPGGPGSCRVGGDAGDVQASDVVFEEYQGVEAFAEHVSMWGESAAMMPWAWR